MCIFNYTYIRVAIYALNSLLVLLPFSVLYLNSHLFAFAFLSIILFFTDLKHFLLPLKVLSSMAVLGILAQLSSPLLAVHLYSAFFVCLAFLLLKFLCQFLLKKECIGSGDILLLACIAINWGPFETFEILLISSFLGSFFGLLLILLKKRDRHEQLPFGSLIIMSFYIALFLDPWSRYACQF